MFPPLIPRRPCNCGAPTPLPYVLQCRCIFVRCGSFTTSRYCTEVVQCVFRRIRCSRSGTSLSCVSVRCRVRLFPLRPRVGPASRRMRPERRLTSPAVSSPHPRERAPPNGVDRGRCVLDPPTLRDSVPSSASRPTCTPGTAARTVTAHGVTLPDRSVDAAGPRTVTADARERRGMPRGDDGRAEDGRCDGSVDGRRGRGLFSKISKTNRGRGWQWRKRRAAERPRAARGAGGEARGSP